MNGVLPLWKPKGLTSHDCVFKLRKILKMKKIGHTGTLDPDVEGVLPICMGDSTKVIPYLSDLHKVYIAEVKLGSITETEDASGKIIETKEVTDFPTPAEIKSALAYFKGEIVQIPPMYSAVRVKGKRLYEYARENLEVERPKRQVTIHDIELNQVNKETGTFVISVDCSKGTYIRTLCVDIGRKLNELAHMSKLERIESDSIKKTETFTFDEINQYAEKNLLSNIILPTKDVLKHLPTYQVDEKMKQLVLYGQKFILENMDLYSDKPFKMMYQDEFLAIYSKSPDKQNEYRALRVFNEAKGEGENY